VVRSVLGAVLEELARVGYGALRIEDVAARAEVNKTTVYRRWPTKTELVQAALLSITSDRVTAPDTGSLRTDLLEVARKLVATFSSCEGQSFMRLVISEGPGSELLTIVKSLRKVHESVPRSVAEAAEARGELGAGVDAPLLFDVLIAALHRKLMMDRESVDDAYLCRLVDLLLLGVLARGEACCAGANGARRKGATPSGRKPRL
jgi:AcrR family transcriptional regulator